MAPSGVCRVKSPPARRRAPTKPSRAAIFINTREAFVNSLDFIHYTPPITVSTEIFAENVQTPLVIGWQSVMLGAASAADALADMQAGIQAVLDR